MQTAPENETYMRSSDTIQLALWLNEYCPDRQDLLHYFNASSPFASHFDNIILIVNFNYPKYYNVIPIVELLYRRAFQNIIYCGYGLDKPPFDVWFVSVSDSYDGYQTGGAIFECINKVVDLNLDVKGYFTIGDDTLLYYWNLVPYNLDAVWISYPGYGIFDLLHSCWSREQAFKSHNETFKCGPDKGGWYWWNFYYKNTIQTFLGMHTTSDSKIDMCLSNLIHRNKGIFRVNLKGAIGDAYYIPQRLGLDFAKVSRFMESYKVYLEIVIPTTIQCIEGSERVTLIPAVNHWTQKDREFVEDNLGTLLKFASDKTYYHPMKLYALVKKDAEKLTMFCKHLLPMFLKH